MQLAGQRSACCLPELCIDAARHAFRAMLADKQDPTEEQAMTLRRILLSTILATTASCAGGHAIMRGSVVMKIDSTKAHVCLGRGEVAVNDRVRLYKNVCDATSGKRTVCTRTQVAEGSVVELLDEHYSVVQFPADTTFEEGNTVERL